MNLSKSYQYYLALIAVLIVLVLIFLKRKYSYWERKRVYSEPVSIIFGNSKEVAKGKKTFGEEFKRVYLNFKKKNLDYGGYYSFIKPIFVPVNLDLINRLMVKDFQYFTDHASFSHKDIEPLTDHLFNLKGSRWRKMRGKLTPTFTSGKMKMMFQLLLSTANNLQEVIENFIDNKEPVFIKDLSARFTTDVIMLCAFGLDANCIKNPESEVRKYGEMVFDNTTSSTFVRIFALVWPKVITLLKINTLPKEFTKFFNSTIKSVVEYREENNIIRKDFMHLLIQLKNNVKIDQNDVGFLKNLDDNDNNDGISMDELMAQAFVFWLAGFETSSTTTTFCMYHLSENLQLQEKLREEINNVLRKHDDKITYEALQEMTFMQKCIDETLRMYPPVPIHTRLCTKTYKIPNSDLTIEKGDSVFIPVFGIHRDPEIYPDPDRFDPERFTPENVSKRHSSAWIPFGDGPRLCIGQRFGIMQTKMALTTMIRNFKFTLNPKTEIPIQLIPRGFLLTTMGDIYLDAEKI